MCNFNDQNLESAITKFWEILITHICYVFLFESLNLILIEVILIQGQESY